MDTFVQISVLVYFLSYFSWFVGMQIVLVLCVHIFKVSASGVSSSPKCCQIWLTPNSPIGTLDLPFFSALISFLFFFVQWDVFYTQLAHKYTYIQTTVNTLRQIPQVMLLWQNTRARGKLSLWFWDMPPVFCICLGKPKTNMYNSEKYLFCYIN